MSEAFVDLYGPEWATDIMIESSDLRCAHLSLADTDIVQAVFQVASFVQAWLYFGLLEAVFGMQVSLELFVYENTDGRFWLHSRCLPSLCEAWAKHTFSLDDETRDMRLFAARDCALRAGNILSDLFAFSTNFQNNSGLVKFHSLLLLIEPAVTALHDAIVVYVEFALRLEIRAIAATFRHLPKKYVENLIAKGWCPYMISTAETYLAPSFLQYID